ncbi:MAG: class I SAM-dependent methyltransferase [Thermoanaerobaculia bacterium]|nr:class I SAM-dependent methyltransferase [Thermoanaerobaculia bacterium]
MNLRTLRLIALDTFDVITRRRAPMTPSRLRIDAVGGGDFRAIGKHLAALVIGPGALQPDNRILDVACGIGRLAVPLTRHLTTGSYIGFDVSSAAIFWCRRAISSKHPNFEFIHSDVYSRHYNSRGGVAATEFVFPAADASVDVVFMGSILTFFLLDDAVRARLRARELEPAFISIPTSGGRFRNRPIRRQRSPSTARSSSAHCAIAVSRCSWSRAGCGWRVRILRRTRISSSRENEKRGQPELSPSVNVDILMDQTM